MHSEETKHPSSFEADGIRAALCIAGTDIRVFRPLIDRA
jgi:hypothetical protein